MAMAVGALVLAACGDDDGGEDGALADEDIVAELDGREFVSTEVDGYELAAGSEIRLVFQGEEIAIHAGCNNMGGTYTVSDGVLVAEQLMMTAMACPEPLMEQDSWVSGFLAAGAEVAVEGDTLTLTRDSATITLLDREVAEPDVALEGTEWTVESLVSAEAVSSMLADTAAVLIIDGDTVSVEAGCNTGTGSAEVDEEAGTITFGPLATTRKACEPAVMEQEDMILSVLSGEVSYEIESDRLSLTNVADPTIGLTLVATP